MMDTRKASRLYPGTKVVAVVDPPVIGDVMEYPRADGRVKIRVMGPADRRGTVMNVDINKVEILKDGVAP
jgi:hypothetical protein